MLHYVLCKIGIVINVTLSPPSQRKFNTYYIFSHTWGFVKKNICRREKKTRIDAFTKTKLTNKNYEILGLKRDSTMADKLMYISNNDLQNYSFCKLVVETFELNKLIKI